MNLNINKIRFRTISMLGSLLPIILSRENWDWFIAQKQLQNLYQSQTKCPKSCLGWIIYVVMSWKECTFYQKPHFEDFSNFKIPSLFFYLSVSSISSTWEKRIFTLFCSQNPLNFQTDARFWSCYVKNKELETFLSCLHIFSIAKWLLMLVFCKLSRALSHFTYFSSSSFCPELPSNCIST